MVDFDLPWLKWLYLPIFTSFFFQSLNLLSPQHWNLYRLVSLYNSNMRIVMVSPSSSQIRASTEFQFSESFYNMLTFADFLSNIWRDQKVTHREQNNIPENGREKTLNAQSSKSCLQAISLGACTTTIYLEYYYLRDLFQPEGLSCARHWFSSSKLV